ncbi:cell division protein FtsL [Magnetovibrio sp.]|uniref:cell division protein FtsL n=1 Tax=Magnetovibrio sp. TaxID=2024836 RepID=UPI002F95F0F1
MTHRSAFLRHTTVLFLLLAGGISMVLFSVKYQVHDLESQYKRLSGELEEERRALHVLHAEWATLNDPARIEALAIEYLNMGPVPPRRVVGPDAMMSIPVREIVFGEKNSEGEAAQ